MIELTFNQWILIYKHARVVALLNRISIEDAVIRIEKALKGFKDEKDNI